MSERLILTCNAGSNSLKAALYAEEDLRLHYRFAADRVHDAPHLDITGAKGEQIKEAKGEAGYDEALRFLFDWLKEHHADAKIAAISHRIVHGGERFDRPVRVDEAIRTQLEALVPLAPLHQPHNLALIDAAQNAHPEAMQIACFDTAFHRTQPWLAQQYALPRELAQKEAIKRYGFHGLSYEYIAHRLPEVLSEQADGRVAVLHLGGGASICAMKARQSVATTMGFTALDGLMMGTRCGDLDPGVILYLLKEKAMPANEVEALLYKQSGLLGVSGISGDMRDVQASDDPHAREAVDLFCYYAARQLGGLIMALGGLDAIVFTGAMGCGDAGIRRRIAAYVQWMGLALDEEANQTHRSCISSQHSPISAHIIQTDEEKMLARHAKRLLQPLQ